LTYKTRFYTLLSMAHVRKRHILDQLSNLSSFWPVVGVLGLRQSGKSTLFKNFLGLHNQVTLDDEDVADEIKLSAKNFLSKQGIPLVIDEVQKAPILFDAIKFAVDKKRLPGSYFLTGSSQFSSKIGIRESLTGRIALLNLHPFTLSEAFSKEFQSARAQPFHGLKPRFKMEDLMPQVSLGGLPVPLFTRETIHREHYFKAWLETSVFRDAARAYGSAYDPELAWSILRQMGQALREGEFPTLSHFKQESRKLRRYLQAFADIFLVRKIACHEAGVGHEVWMPTDSGLCGELMEKKNGEGAALSFARVFLMNEISATNEYSGIRIQPVYYKTSRGAPVDLVWGDTILKVSVSKVSSQAYDERPLLAAMKKIGCQRAILTVPREGIELKKNGLNVLPWTYWS